MLSPSAEEVRRSLTSFVEALLRLDCGRHVSRWRWEEWSFWRGVTRDFSSFFLLLGGAALPEWRQAPRTVNEADLLSVAGACW